MGDSQWVTVFEGPPWEVELLQGLLEEEGIPAVLPDHPTPIMGPWVRGEDPLLERLAVREEDAERAMRLLQSRSGDTQRGDPPDGSEEEAGPDPGR